MVAPARVTKAGVDQVAKITGLPFKIVHELLEAGWTFTWDIQQNYSWTKNGLDNLFDGPLGRPSGVYPLPVPQAGQGPKGRAGDSGASRK